MHLFSHNGKLYAHVCGMSTASLSRTTRYVISSKGKLELGVRLHPDSICFARSAVRNGGAHQRMTPEFYENKAKSNTMPPAKHLLSINCVCRDHRSDVVSRSQESANSGCIDRFVITAVRSGT